MLEILTSGAVVNFILVILGSAVGLIFKKGMPERFGNMLTCAMALCVFYIGVTGIFEENIRPLVIILSGGIGAVIGELIDLDKLVNRLGNAIERRITKGKQTTSPIAEGFVSATLIFCVGAMTVVGSIDSGVSGDNTTLYSKSLIDCITAVVLVSSLGIGVMLSCFSVLFIEGGLTLLATVVGPMLGTDVISHMSVIGSLLIVAISLNMLKITKIKVMNLLPAVFMPLILCLFM